MVKTNTVILIILLLLSISALVMACLAFVKNQKNSQLQLGARPRAPLSPREYMRIGDGASANLPLHSDPNACASCEAIVLAYGLAAVRKAGLTVCDICGGNICALGHAPEGTPGQCLPA